MLSMEYYTPFCLLLPTISDNGWRSSEAAFWLTIKIVYGVKRSDIPDTIGLNEAAIR